jgi:hypothetical protein
MGCDVIPAGGAGDERADANVAEVAPRKKQELVCIVEERNFSR